jgi:hypothetical protein
MNNREYVFESPPPSALNDETIIIKMDHSMQSEAIQSKEIKNRSEISRVFSIRWVIWEPSEQNNKSSRVPICPRESQSTEECACVSLCLCVCGGVCYSEVGQTLTFGYKNSGKDNRLGPTKNLCTNDVHIENNLIILTWRKAESSFCPRVPVD